jgi:hypothetical protein
VLAQLGRDQVPIPSAPTATVDERERRHYAKLASSRVVSDVLARYDAILEVRDSGRFDRP